MTTHHPTIVEIGTARLDDGRLLHQARCTCRWAGWATFDPEMAQRQRDRHLEQAEIDRAVLEGRAGEGR